MGLRPRYGTKVPRDGVSTFDWLQRVRARESGWGSIILSENTILVQEKRACHSPGLRQTINPTNNSSSWTTLLLACTQFLHRPPCLVNCGIRVGAAAGVR